MRRSVSHKKWLFLAVAAAPAIIVGGCSSSSPAQSSYDFDSGSGSDSASSNDSSKNSDGSTSQDGSTPSDGSSASDSSSSADANDSGTPPFMTPDAGPGACDPASTWATGTLIPISTASDDALDSVTPDELTIAWTSGNAIFYSDRASSTDAFGTAQNLDVAAGITAGTYAADRVALSPDGLRLVVVNADEQGFSEFTRTARIGSGNTFASPDVGGFGNIDLDTPSGASVGDPVIGATDTTFFYSVYGGGATSTIYRALRLTSTDAWSSGAALDVATDLQAQGSSRRQPTAISSDNRTLFFYDQVNSIERASWINESTGEFDTFADLGTRVWAAPNSACSTLYYSSAGTSSVDLFSATH